MFFTEKHYLCIAFADMAQLVEQRIRNAWVPGSSPGIGSRLEVSFTDLFFLLLPKNAFLCSVILMIMRVLIRIIALFIVFCNATQSVAQRFGVNCSGATDRETAQLYGPVQRVTERVYKVDFSRHVVDKGELQSVRSVEFAENGSVKLEQTFDAANELLSKTIYQYKDSMKSVSTSYDASGTRTLQTLYANTADGVVARMRDTDAIAVTISTSEVSHMPNWAANNESFNDGERVLTEYFYNDNRRLVRVLKTSNSDVSEQTITLDANGHPKK